MPLSYGSALLQKTAVESFWNGYFSISDPFEGLVYNRTSTQETDTYARLGAAPMPVQWQGEKQTKDVNEFSTTLTNLPYEATIGIDKKLIQFQQWDEIGRVVGNLGEKARMHKVSLLSTLLEAGLSTVCEDGQFFFDTDHASAGAEYTTSQDNDLTAAAATGTIPTDVEFAARVRAIRSQFYTFKDDRGDPTVPPESLDASNFVIMTAPGFMDIAMQVATASSITGPVGNDLQGKFQVRVNPFLAATATTPSVYAFYIHPTRKPFILQEAGGLALDYTEDGDEAFSKGSVRYSASWWGRVGYGEWRTACKQIWT